MSSTKKYAVVLAEPWVKFMSPVRHWIKATVDGLPYLNADRVNPDGTYFHVVIKQAMPRGEQIEMEIQIPHSQIIAVLYAADLKQMGFAP